MPLQLLAKWKFFDTMIQPLTMLSPQMEQSSLSPSQSEKYNCTVYLYRIKWETNRRQSKNIVSEENAKKQNKATFIYTSLTSIYRHRIYWKLAFNSTTKNIYIFFISTFLILQHFPLPSNLTQPRKSAVTLKNWPNH